MTEQTEKKTIIARLITAQQEIGNVTKNAKNPHFQNRFVDITQLLSSVLPVLHKNGLFLTQRVDIYDGKPVLVTQVYDEDGHSLPSSAYPIVAKDMTDPQKVGAGVTYARRYALLAYLGLGTEDDDGNTAAKPKAKSPELQTLIEKLKTAGHTKETIAIELEKRYGKGNRKAITALTPDEVAAWLDELNTVPF
jgi:hypothetical protein